MNRYTQLEDLSNDLFFEIFDYLDALSILTSFTSLNHRISSILQSIPLRVVIAPLTFRFQLDFLSSHLVYYEHQVISIRLTDTICDDSSITELLFGRHDFVNLRRCVLNLIRPDTKLDGFIKKIKYYDKLIQVNLYNTFGEDLNPDYKSELIRTLLMLEAPALRSIMLYFPYNYLNLPDNVIINPNLTSIKLRFFAANLTTCLQSIVVIFRQCQRIKDIGLWVDGSYKIQTYQNNYSNNGLTVANNNLPILTEVKSFEFVVIGFCDNSFSQIILRCMPNLRHFCFHFFIFSCVQQLDTTLLHGYIWRNIFSRFLPCLSKFEFYMIIHKKTSITLDLEKIVASFKYFVQNYSNWHMAINRSKSNRSVNGEIIQLRTMKYEKLKAGRKFSFPEFEFGTFETRSTCSADDHYLLYPDQLRFKLFLTDEKPKITWTYPLFRRVKSLTIRMPINSSWWNSLSNFVSFRQNIGDDNVIKDYVTCLSRFVDLSKLLQLELDTSVSIAHWKHVQFILYECSNIINLFMNTPLLILPRFIDNSSLFTIFKRIKFVRSIANSSYFPLHLTSKIIERFPSLEEIELRVYSFDHCVSIIDKFLCQLEHLFYIKIYYHQDTLLDNPFSREYIYTKRCQMFPDKTIYLKKINVIKDDNVIYILM